MGGRKPRPVGGSLQTAEKGGCFFGKHIPFSTMPICSNDFDKQNPKPELEEVGLVEWKDEMYKKIARIISTVLLTLILCSAMVILHLVPSMTGRILTAAALSLLFSTTLALCTNARAAEIFAGTAAFAAVEVVYIGSTSFAS
jgi:hypothetical protein